MSTHLASMLVLKVENLLFSFCSVFCSPSSHVEAGSTLSRRLWTSFSLPPWPSVQHIEASVCPVEELFRPVGA
jgi:hypothetical protein